MSEADEIQNTASTVRNTLGNLMRRMQQTRAPGALSWRETSAITQLARFGPATAAELARSEGISPQSMGETLKAIEAAGMIERGTDPGDKRRVVFSVTDSGRDFYRSRVDARTAQFVKALSEGFTREELEQLSTLAPLLDRLADRLYESLAADSQQQQRADGSSTR